MLHAMAVRCMVVRAGKPFSARARDCVQHAMVIYAIRLHYPEFASNDGVAAIDKLTDEWLNEVRAF